MTVQNGEAYFLIGGVYTKLPLFASEGMSIQIGPDPDSGTQPTKITCTLDNRDGSADPSNVLGARYGQIGRNTPMQARIGGVVLGYAEAASWSPDETLGFRQTPPRGRAWVDVVGLGILDRLKSWQEPLRSPMYTEINSYSSLLGYWPLEGSGDLFPNETTGRPAAAAGTVTAGGNDGPAGSDKVVTLGSDGSLSGNFLPASGNGYQVCWSMQIPNVLTASVFTLFSFTTTDGLRFEWQANNTTFNFNVIGADGSTLATLSSLFGGIAPTSWIRCRFRVTYAAGTVTVEPAWYAQDAASILGVTFTYAAGGTGRPRAWSVGSNAYTNAAAYGHVFAVTDTSLDLAGSYSATQVFNGYVGELAFDRWARLLTGVGVARFIIGDRATTMPMGPQKPGLLYDLLEECVATERGLHWDSENGQGLTFRTRLSRFGQTSHLDLTKGVNVAAPFGKMIDPVGVANRVTVNNASGASATVTRAAGTLSVLPPPNGVGEIRGQVDVNMRDDALVDDRAAWELNLSTLDRPRYQTIVVDLVANPSLLTAVNNLRSGDLITLAGVEPNPVPLHMIQKVHAIGTGTRTCTLKCVPGDQWASGVYGTARYAVRTSTTNATMTTTSTTLSVLLTDPLDTWSQTATGYQVVVGGELMTVTSPFSAPVSMVQSATVTRSVNGVVRSHAVGEKIDLYQAARYAYTSRGSGGASMVAGGDVIAAGDLNRAFPQWLQASATGSLGASKTGTLIPGCTITFTTAGANAVAMGWFTMRADPTAAGATTVISSRILITGPSSFSAGTDFAVAAWAAGTGGDLMTTGNQGKITLGAAGTYTAQLLGTTGANEDIGIYSSLLLCVQEVAP